MKKVALITGASSGIGKETALLFLKNDFIVYAAARRLERMHDLEEAGIHIIQMDVTDDYMMIKSIQEILNTEKRIDVLVNNAGYGSYGSLEDVPLSEARYQFEVNVFGMARLTQLVLPHMRSQKSGRIINISSVAGKFGEPHGSWYHATKFAVEGLSDCLRMELKQFGVDVVIIEPGLIKTEWNTIARENLMKVSGNTVYKDLASKHVNMLKSYDDGGSDPSVIANTIIKAALKKSPKTRYAVGYGSWFILFARKIFPDKIFDKIMLSQIK